jgi:hypothetical protein
MAGKNILSKTNVPSDIFFHTPIPDTLTVNSKYKVPVNVEDRFLNNLDNDSELLSISEGVEDMDLQLFLISFVEFNIDINALELGSLVLLRMYWNGNMVKLATHLNHFLQQLKDAGIQHDLPYYVPQNLPPIDLME